LGQFVFKPGMRGRVRLEAARGHDDLVIATALAVLPVDLAGCRDALKPKSFGDVGGAPWRASPAATRLPRRREFIRKWDAKRGRQANLSASLPVLGAL
jgi:hypothetical protein